MESQPSQKNSMLKTLSIRDFRFLFLGSTTSIIGDQFAFIATPWLVLKMTGDPLALGIVLALGGIPRAVFMLLGGAITDRISPRLVMLSADIIRFLLTALMALAVVTGSVQMWMLYAFSLGFGLVAGFAIPASNSIVPMLVEDRDLQAGNSLIMGTDQLVGFLGPTIAGILIASYSKSPLGITLAYAIDAFSFAVSAFCLWAMRSGHQHAASAESAKKDSVLASIWAGMKYLWDDRVMRMMFLVVTTMNFLFVGPLLVGIPVLADQRLPEGAVAFGLLMSAYSGGNLAGYLLAGALPRPAGKVMRLFLIGLLFIFGLGLCSLGFIRSTWIDFAIMLVVGLGNGYISIIMFTWIQVRTPRLMLGRMMSMIMLSNIGLVPVSQALSGAVSRFSLTGLFAASGALILLLALLTAPRPEVIAFSEGMVSSSPSPQPVE
jgi:MFS family permease